MSPPAKFKDMISRKKRTVPRIRLGLTGRAKIQLEEDDNPVAEARGSIRALPRPAGSEVVGDYVQRCLISPEARKEFQDVTQRGEACLKRWEGKVEFAANGILRFDPTRTKSIRDAWSRDLRKRFRKLKGWINKSVVENDCFGLIKARPLVLARFVDSPIQVPGVIPAKLFAFETDAQKVEEFLGFLFEQTDKGILEIIPGGPGVVARTHVGSTQWQDMYIESSYKKGINRSWNEGKKLGLTVPEGGFAMEAAFNSPIHADKVGLIYTRAFNDLRGITDQMATGISRTLAQGLTAGLGPREMARQMTKQVDISSKRSILIARTETIRAHHVSNINTYKELGIEGVKVQAEWSTAGDDRVCARCNSLEGQIFKLKDIEMLIPLHPNCRCIALPVLKKHSKKGKRGKTFTPVDKEPIPTPVVPAPSVIPKFQKAATFKEASDWAKANGSATVARTVDQAADAKIIGLENNVIQEIFRDERGNLIQRKFTAEQKVKFRKRWRKAFNSKTDWDDIPYEKTGNAFANIPDKEFVKVQNAINRNHSNAKYRKYTDKYGESPVILQRVPVNMNRAGEHLGGTTHLFDDELLRTPFNDKVGKMKLGGSFSTEGFGGGQRLGLDPILRHEYGHNLFGDKASPEFKKQWESLFLKSTKEELRAASSGYGATTPDEFFAEVFAIHTHQGELGVVSELFKTATAMIEKEFLP